MGFSSLTSLLTEALYSDQMFAEHWTRRMPLWKDAPWTSMSRRDTTAQRCVSCEDPGEDPEQLFVVVTARLGTCSQQKQKQMLKNKKRWHYYWCANVSNPNRNESNQR